MSNEAPVKNIIQAVTPALEIANSIFNSEKYQNEEKVHPKLKILLSATLKLQQELRKGLFSRVFNESNDTQVVLEFFQYKR